MDSWYRPLSGSRANFAVVGKSCGISPCPCPCPCPEEEEEEYEDEEEEEPTTPPVIEASSDPFLAAALPPRAVSMVLRSSFSSELRNMMRRSFCSTCTLRP